MTTSDESTAKQNELIETAGKVLLKNYLQQPTVMARGSGVELFDVSGKRFLDLTSGISVCALGHAHPELSACLAEQTGKLLHTSNLYFIEEQITAAQALTERSFADRVYFCNSGAEANEAALKLARRYQHVVRESPERNLIVSTEGSFHGRSIATVAITGQDKYRSGFGPLLEDVAMVPYGDLAAATAILEKRTACCFILEPIQAEGGIIVPRAGYLQGLRAVCDATDTILIFDEVQTGVGRTGKWWGYEWDGVTPDVMSMAKGLGGGVPIGAIGATEKAAEGLTFRQGGAVPHASTFGGNPLACCAASNVLRIIEEQGLLANAMTVGDHIASRFEELVQKYPDTLVEHRGRGLLRGLVMKDLAGPTYRRCREEGLLVSVAGGYVLRFAPALVATTDNVDEGIAILDSVLKNG
ncbi:MAG: aspartate aminotransferase family protein [Myxococcales bacterium]|nr:aspartate aminotransferase family protein [Myxococcales bacterium]